MSDNSQETVADIVQELRVLSDKWIEDKSMTKTECLGLIAHQIAYRLDAAWKREKSEIEASALSVGGIVEAARNRNVQNTSQNTGVKLDISPVGNAAAMREAARKRDVDFDNWRAEA